VFPLSGLNNGVIRGEKGSDGWIVGRGHWSTNSKKTPIFRHVKMSITVALVDTRKGLIERCRSGGGTERIGGNPWSGETSYKAKIRRGSQELSGLLLCANYYWQLHRGGKQKPEDRNNERLWSEGRSKSKQRKKEGLQWRTSLTMEEEVP